MIWYPIAVSLRATTNCDTSTGSIEVMAWGSRIDRIVWLQLKPSAEAASCWPRGSEPTPERTISAITAPLYSVSPVTTPASARYFDGNVS